MRKMLKRNSKLSMTLCNSIRTAKGEKARKIFKISPKMNRLRNSILNSKFFFKNNKN